ncbi:hypothetical protein [Streptomyces sp. NPDC059788]|uniref:hypothetical protein n=1 Tax=Streptomyces sp. NPDC059788 TaxID=3346948 RepID=UPI0036572146
MSTTPPKATPASEHSATDSNSLQAAVLDPTRCAVRSLPQPGTTQAAIINVHVTHAVRRPAT